MIFNSNPHTATLAELLKTNTQANHQQVEKLLMSRMRCVKSISAYVHLLGVFYGYFGAAEQSLGRFLDKNSLPDFESRRKVQSLKSDISYFNGSIPPLALENELPEVRNNLQAFGILYVLEGSTLGGAIISRVLQKQLQLEGRDGFLFFNGYGTETETMWRNFRNALESITTTPEEREVVITSANSTFLLFGKWIEKNY